jgi:Zn-dependent M28 family amino/carboxypeptidase
MLKKQCDFGPRPPGSEAHRKTQAWLAEEMRKYCDNVRIQSFSHYWSVNQRTLAMGNVLGEQNWKDAKVRVVLLAHWDTRPYADHDPDPEKAKLPILGANDGASGVAVLLGVMRAMKDNLPKDLGILYLMTDGEDLGPGLDEMFLGATHFSKNLPTPKPDYGILLDMVGDKDLVIPVEPYSYEAAPELMRDLFGLAARLGMSSTFPWRGGPRIEDDHRPLIRAGIPTIDLIDFSYEPWHTAGDTVDKCSPGSLGKVGRLMVAWLRQAPVWQPPR